MILRVYKVHRAITIACFRYSGRAICTVHAGEDNIIENGGKELYTRLKRVALSTGNTNTSIRATARRARPSTQDRAPHSHRSRYPSRSSALRLGTSAEAAAKTGKDSEAPGKMTDAEASHRAQASIELDRATVVVRHDTGEQRARNPREA